MNKMVNMNVFVVVGVVVLGGHICTESASEVSFTLSPFMMRWQGFKKIHMHQRMKRSVFGFRYSDTVGTKLLQISSLLGF